MSKEQILLFICLFIAIPVGYLCVTEVDFSSITIKEVKKEEKSIDIGMDEEAKKTLLSQRTSIDTAKWVIVMDNGKDAPDEQTQDVIRSEDPPDIVELTVTLDQSSEIVQVNTAEEMEQARVEREKLGDKIEASYFLQIEHLINPGALAVKLKKPQTLLSEHISDKLSLKNKEHLKEWDEKGSVPLKFQEMLVADLNRVMGQTSLYEKKRFEQIILSPDIHKLIEKNPAGKELVRLNRLLLEKAYPNEISVCVHSFVASKTIETKVYMKIWYATWLDKMKERVRTWKAKPLSFKATSKKNYVLTPLTTPQYVKKKTKDLFEKICTKKNIETLIKKGFKQNVKDHSFHGDVVALYALCKGYRFRKKVPAPINFTRQFLKQLESTLFANKNNYYVAYSYSYFVLFLFELHEGVFSAGNSRFLIDGKSKTEQNKAFFQEMIERTVAVYAQSQQANGGWRYLDKQNTEEDFSITGVAGFALEKMHVICRAKGYTKPYNTLKNVLNRKRRFFDQNVILSQNQLPIATYYIRTGGRQSGNQSYLLGNYFANASIKPRLMNQFVDILAGKALVNGKPKKYMSVSLNPHVAYRNLFFARALSIFKYRLSLLKVVNPDEAKELESKLKELEKQIDKLFYGYVYFVNRKQCKFNNAYWDSFGSKTLPNMSTARLMSLLVAELIYEYKFYKQTAVEEK